MSSPLYVAFIWHMHQPPYRDPVGGGCLMPWVRLHGTKDYLDMLIRLEAFPAIHQTFNLVPSLLDQIEDYLPPHNRSDTFLDLSRKPAESLTAEEQRFILQWFFLAHPERMIRPHPRYHDLLAKRGLHPSEGDWPQILRRFKPQDFRDLQVWFNLAWIDPWLRSQDERLAALERKGASFTEAEKGAVLEAQLGLLGRVLPAYRQAADRGQVELSTSPYYHPILPLWCDLRDAQIALPHLPLPPVTVRYPQDARWHISQGIARHEAAFGRRPAGLWPPEGGVSETVVHLALEAGLTWIATDEAILWRTLKSSRAPSALYRPHVLRRGEGRLAIVFRDRELSDLIGFVYSQWRPREAVADFLRRLGEIHEQFRRSSPPALVTIILDGENAWEFYPNDGHEFLTELYGALSEDARFRCVTVSEFLAQHPVEGTESLPPLFAGSWIDGNFATWVGHPEKNLAWERLAALRETLAGQSLDAPEQEALRRSLGMAQASDWMWWFGDTHVTAQAEEFDRLFRMHAANSYRLAGAAVPSALSHPVKRRPSAAMYDPTGSLRVTVDGRETSYYEWLYAGRIDLRRQYAAIHRGEQILQGLAYGFDGVQYYLRVDVDLAALRGLKAWTIELGLSHGATLEVSPDGDSAKARLSSADPASLRCALGRFLEVSFPLGHLALEVGERLELTATLKQGAEALERHPADGTFSLAAATIHLDSHAWSA